MQFSAFTYLASAIAATIGVSIESILVDITNIRERVTSLIGAINNYPATCGSRAGAAGIHYRAEDTWTAIIKTINDVKTIREPVSVADGVRILNSINALKPLVLEALRVVVDKKPAFQSLNMKSVLNFVADDLVELNQTTTALENVFISRTPPELLEEANAIRAEIDSAFIVAIAVYSPAHLNRGI
ncbi:hypothetical protein AN958_03265 [Leucoagaricus sp. SymC.cos]|nr:hypothetical protein AN958_03265 [Leucoagaricus sp. SymC.cos]